MEPDRERESRLVAFERRLGGRLPEDYRMFLLSGPMPRYPNEEEREQFASDDPAEAKREYYRDTLNSFYDLDSDDPERDLAGNHEATQDVFPAGLIPIAQDPADNLILLGVSGEHAGRVYYWHHDTGDGPEVWESIESMTATFAEFLAHLRDEAGEGDTRR